MASLPERSSGPLNAGDSLYPRWVRLLERTELVCLLFGVIAAVLQRGLNRVTYRLHLELGIVVVGALLLLTVSLLLRLYWSRTRITFLRSHRVEMLLSLAWIAGILTVLIVGKLFPGVIDPSGGRGDLLLGWSELLIVLRGIVGIVTVIRMASAGGTNPAVVLVASFALLVFVGTLLLMLPRARAHAGNPGNEEGAPLIVALFTATSAGCVTGLTVEPTGTYWSQLGQIVILCLFQIGGLGIMTCGAFFAVLAGRHMPIRESATLREMLESDGLADVRRLVLAILGFTLVSEVIGAVMISGLWSDRPLGQQAYYSLFHAVSAFCNAGFSLTPNSFVGYGTRWQIWGALSILIVLGGIGFAVLYNLVLAVKSRLSRNRFPAANDVKGVSTKLPLMDHWINCLRSFGTIRTVPLFNLPRQRVRLQLTSIIVLWTTAALLVCGAVGYGLLESTGPPRDDSVSARFSEAWFQSITFRTAGFSTVDHQTLQPATKLFAILLMFIGASPGSMGGGVKTVCFALTVLSLVSILRGRERVEIMGRTVPQVLVNRALTIMSLGIFVVAVSTMLLVVFEQQPHRFLDQMFEATSAFATVGVSAGITSELTVPSQLVIIVTMFLGRVGPLTLLIALAGRMHEARFEYPLERVTLG
jgi:trk system potassium uptake protein TrkH